MTKLEREFAIFDADNPDIYRLFKKLSLEVIDRGFDNYSARTILHRMRWHYTIETVSVDGFKINDHHSPYYARKFMAEFPEHDGFFRNRVVASDKPARNDDVWRDGPQGQYRYGVLLAGLGKARAIEGDGMDTAVPEEVGAARGLSCLRS